MQPVEATGTTLTYQILSCVFVRRRATISPIMSFCRAFVAVVALLFATLCPAAIEFGKAVVGETSNDRVKNNGAFTTGDLSSFHVDSWEIAGANPGDFEVVSEDLGDRPGGSGYMNAYIHLSFHPTAYADRTAQVTMHFRFYHYNPNSHQYELGDAQTRGPIGLHGYGVMPDPTPGSNSDGQPSFCMASDGNPKSIHGSINEATGNAQVVAQDPVTTRGYPLTVNIYVNTHNPGLISSAMGNADFTYGITVKAVDSTFYPSYSRHWIVRDGDGTYVDFGDYTKPPVAAPGVFSTLTHNPDGSFVISNAGPPTHIRRYGNYRYEFSATGKLMKLRDPAGNWQILTYNGSNLYRVDDLSSKKYISFEYSGGLISMINENGVRFRTRLSYHYNLLEEVALLNSNNTVATRMTYAYNSYDLLDTVTRDLDATTAAHFSYFVYDTMGGYRTTSRANVDTGLFASHINWLTNGSQPGSSRVDVTDAKGNVTQLAVNKGGDLVAVKPPLYSGATGDPTIRMTYDGRHNVTSVVGPGIARAYAYDSHGQLTKATDGAGGFTAYTYIGADLKSMSDVQGTILNVYYEDTRFPHVPTRFENADFGSWVRTLNSFGQVIKVTPPPGSASSFATMAFDENPTSMSYGWPSYISQNGVTTYFTGYDYMGDVAKVTSPIDGGGSVSETMGFDGAQRPTALTHADGTQRIWSYTGRKLFSLLDEVGRKTTFDWCSACGRLMGIHRPLGWSNTLSQDADRNVTAFKDARLHATGYAYGANRELTRMTYPDGNSTRYFYDALGRVRQVTNGRGQNMTLAYDNAGRLISRIGTGFSERFYYNGDGSVRQIISPTYSVNYGYTLTRQLASVTTAVHGAPTQLVEYTYFADGKLSTLKWSCNGSQVVQWNYSYGKGGHVSQVSNTFGESTNYEYDLQGKLITQLNANSTETDYGYYQNRGWVSRITQKAKGSVYTSYALTYDDGLNRIARLTQVGEANGSVARYRYDDLDRLTSAQRTGTAPYTTSFGYDLTGNVTALNGATFGSYDAANKLLTSPYGNPAYDGDGNMLNRGTGASFSWDGDSHMTSQSNPAATATYQYDFAGRRIESKLAGGVPTFYVFSGGQVIGEVRGGIPVAAYTWGADGLISEAIIAGGEHSSYWYHFGPQGETRQVTDHVGTIVGSYQYSPYGLLTSVAGSVSNPFRFGGKYGYYSDGFSNLILCGQRWYSPIIYRWMSRDLLGYASGENVFIYCNDNPMSFADPSGLIPFGADPNAPQSTDDFVPNGCGGQGPFNSFIKNYLWLPPDGSWGDCCNLHDWRYYLGGGWKEKQYADEQLRNCMDNTSSIAPGLIYWQFVSWFGDPNFNFNQSEQPSTVLPGLLPAPTATPMPVGPPQIAPDTALPFVPVIPPIGGHLNP